MSSIDDCVCTWQSIIRISLACVRSKEISRKVSAQQPSTGSCSHSWPYVRVAAILGERPCSAARDDPHLQGTESCSTINSLVDPPSKHNNRLSAGKKSVTAEQRKVEHEDMLEVKHFAHGSIGAT